MTAVTIAVVSWNTRELLLRCLSSLAADVEAGLAEVVVIDNGSSDGSVAAARELAPWARVLEPGENLGFGRAFNLVARDSTSPWLACANADVALEPGSLERLLRAGAGDPGIGGVAPLLELPDGAVQHSIGSLPSLRQALAVNLAITRARPRVGEELLLAGAYDPRRARDVGWAIGAFLLLRRRALDEAGLFDERRWMYAEDLDLCWRLREAGWRIRYVPGARVLHQSGAAAVQAFGGERAERFMRETYAVVLAHRGLVRTRLIAAVNWLGAAARVLALAPFAGRSERARGRREECRVWARAHRQGLRAARELRSGG